MVDGGAAVDTWHLVEAVMSHQALQVSTFVHADSASSAHREVQAKPL